MDDSKRELFLSLCDIIVFISNIYFLANVRYREGVDRIYTSHSLGLYTLAVRDIDPTHWAYIPNTSANYPQHLER